MDQRQIIKFKHYRTDEVLTKVCSILPEYNKQSASEYIIVFNHTDDHIEAIIKKSIVSQEDI